MAGISISGIEYSGSTTSERGILVIVMNLGLHIPGHNHSEIIQLH